VVDFPHADFVNDEFLGRDAIYTPAGGQAVSLRVTFTKDAEGVSLGGQVNPEGFEIQAGCDAALVVGVKRGDTLAVDGVTYTVSRWHPDETGWMTMFLKEPIA
jgi:hypothetical protein